MTRRDWICPRCCSRCDKHDRFCWFCGHDTDKDPPDEWDDDVQNLYLDVLTG